MKLLVIQSLKSWNKQKTELEVTWTTSKARAEEENRACSTVLPWQIAVPAPIPTRHRSPSDTTRAPLLS